MLSLFPVHRPSYGVGINRTSLSLVALRRLPFCRPVVTHSTEQPLQTGCVLPSASTPNVSMEAVQEELRTLTHAIRGRAAAISLPDETATIGLFSFDTVPQQAKDREALIRWKFEQDMHVKLGKERLVYNLYPRNGAVSVLAAATDSSVLARYRAMFEAASVLPVSVGLHTFHVFDAFRGSMKAAPESFFVHCNGDSLTFIALSHGCPVFLRQRHLKSSSASFREELFGTLQYFDDRFPPSEAADDRPSPLYLVDTRTEASPEESFGARAGMAIPALRRSKSIEVIPLTWSDSPVAESKTRPLSRSLLPAAAGVAIA